MQPKNLDEISPNRERPSAQCGNRKVENLCRAHCRKRLQKGVTLVMMPLSRKPTSEALKEWHALYGFSQFYLQPMHLSAYGMNHAFAFPAKAGPHFTDPGGMEG